MNSKNLTKTALEDLVIEIQRSIKFKDLLVIRPTKLVFVRYPKESIAQYKKRHAAAMLQIEKQKKGIK